MRDPLGLQPIIAVDREDLGGRGYGMGAFTRVYQQGDALTLEAQSAVGMLQCRGWRGGDGKQIAPGATLSLTLGRDQDVEPIYG